MAIRSATRYSRSEEHTSELQSLRHLVCRLLLEKKSPDPYRLMKLGGFLGIDTDRHPMPCDILKYDTKTACYVVPLHFFFLKKAPPPEIYPFPPHDPLQI